MKLFKNRKIKLVLIGITAVILAVSNIAAGNEGVQITVLYDNYTLTEGCRTDWGFSCIVTGMEKCILFDTGTDGNILLDNAERLQAPTQDVEQVVISHNHYDHIGGLLTFLGTNHNVSVYLPPSVPSSDISNIQATGAGTQVVNAQMQLCERTHLTGPLGTNIIEQAMVLETPKGLVVITGCAHPGVVNIVQAAKQMLDKDVYLVLGGFHLGGQSDSQVRSVIQQLKSLGVQKAGPSHCTGDRAIELFRQEYGDDFVPMGIGKITIPTQYDLNEDGTVDVNDLVIIIENWGQPNPLADIAPSPFGDGIVNIQDMAVLVEHMLEQITPDEPEEVNVDEDDAGSQVKLEQGQVLIVTLESNPTTGYRWEVAENQESILEQIGESEFKPSGEGEDEPPMAGAGGQEIFRFKTISAGQTTLRLVYRRPWEEGVEPANTFSIEVVVH